MPDTIRSKVIELLSAAGWAVEWKGPVVLRKTFDTAAGPRDGSIRLTDFNPEGQCWFMPVYMSEGRNVAESCWGFVTAGSDEAGVAQAVSGFLGRLNTAIDASYARKLLLGRGVNEYEGAAAA